MSQALIFTERWKRLSIVIATLFLSTVARAETIQAAADERVLVNFIREYLKPQDSEQESRTLTATRLRANRLDRPQRRWVARRVG